MAKAPAKQSPVIVPEDTFRVDLARSIRVGRSSVHPGQNVKLRGDVLAAVIEADPEAVLSYEPATIAAD